MKNPTKVITKTMTSESASRVNEMPAEKLPTFIQVQRVCVNAVL